MSTDESLLHGRYKLINTLGHGGMCKVYLAEDTQNPEQPDCVVKTLKPALQDPQQLKTAKNLFQRGATALAKLGDHPQIPRLLDFFEEDDEFYTVEEFIQGHALTLEMQPGERWTEANVIDLLQEILPILEFIHGQNIIHRDIKPDNILRRDKDNQLVLIDFGAVRQINVQPTTTVGPGRTGTIVGTYGYMPTEQGHGNPRPNSDIYALGILCIQALTGLLPPLNFCKIRKPVRCVGKGLCRSAPIWPIFSTKWCVITLRIATKALQKCCGPLKPSAASGKVLSPEKHNPRPI
jgi:serine/threonine protein kinase, bacterial